MKRFVLLIFIGMSVSLWGESRISIGPEYGTYWENWTAGSSIYNGKITSPGVDLTSVFYPDRGNLGFHSSVSFLFPNSWMVTNNGVTSVMDFSLWDIFYQMNLGIGPALKIPINDMTFFQVAVDVEYTRFYGATNQNGASGTIEFHSFGLGGDLAAVIDLNKSVFFTVGSRFGYDFLNSAEMTMTSDYGTSYSTDSRDNYRVFRMNPYLNIGFIF